MGTNYVLDTAVVARDFETGSVGYGFYGPVQIEGVRHQVTVNVVVNGSKKWDDEKKVKWLEKNANGATIHAEGYPDTFKSGNTGWRINAAAVINGEQCTISGSVILSKKTVAQAGAKAEKNAAKAARLAEGKAQHEAALKALRASVKAVTSKA